MKATIETTDTFCGEANYAWVERHTLEVPDGTSDRAVIRRLKKKASVTLRHRKTDFGDWIRLDYPNVCIASFITFE